MARKVPYILCLLTGLCLCVIAALLYEVNFTENVAIPGHDRDIDVSIDSDQRGRILEMLSRNDVNEDEILKTVMQQDVQECDCGDEFVYGPINGNAKIQREIELETLERLERPSQEPIVICHAMSPLTYVGGGITVEPLQAVKLVGISIDKLFWQSLLQYINFNITLSAIHSYGVIHVTTSSDFGENIILNGNGSPRLSISVNVGTDINILNMLLECLSYQSMKYDIELRDIINVRLLDFEIKVHVHVHRQPYPRLYDVAPSDHISRKVSIVTKTFERYETVRELIRSIREFYPNVTIIIADDSENQQKLSGKSIKHYVMPFAAGWFAGRNLLVSQVRTKYFLWVDDDFTFSKNTKLERFIEKFETPNLNLDLIAGRYEDRKGDLLTRNYDRVIHRRRSRDGYCMVREKGNHGKLEGFPQCNITDEVTNFFMAKTLSVRDIGFDPANIFDRVGHYEFFWDGLGKLRIASCDDVTIRHFFSHDYSEKYEHFRHAENDDIHYYKRLMFSIYKNNLKCLAGMDRNIYEDYTKF
ncbi:beta-1,4 N-acetylgalactosaminyltransferase 1-like [Glandiceps talaboti]